MFRVLREVGGVITDANPLVLMLRIEKGDVWSSRFTRLLMCGRNQNWAVDWNLWTKKPPTCTWLLNLSHTQNLKPLFTQNWTKLDKVLDSSLLTSVNRF